MTARFADTNVLLYAISTDPAEYRKAMAARLALDDVDLRLSVQVLQEFCVQATRESRSDAPTREQAALLVRSFWRFRPLAITKESVGAAADACARFRISYWDAAIVEAARLTGCTTVLSEDLGDGQDYAGIRVENPFRDS